MTTIAATLIGTRGSIGINDVYIEAWVTDLAQDCILGAAAPRQDGSFAISYEDNDLKSGRGGEAPDIYINVYQANKLLKTTKAEPLALVLRTYPDIPVADTPLITSSVFINVLPEGVINLSVGVEPMRTSGRQDPTSPRQRRPS